MFDHNALLDFTGLPEELKLCAFDFLDIEDLLVASHVCRDWRERACLCPTYWRKISISSDSPATAEFFVHRLNLTQNPGLVITITIENASAEGAVVNVVLPALRNALERIAYLKLRVPRSIFDETCAALGQPAGILGTFILEVVRIWGDPDPELSETLFEGECPALKTLGLYHIRLPTSGVPAFRSAGALLRIAARGDPWQLTEVLNLPALKRISIGRSVVAATDWTSLAGLSTLQTFSQLNYLRITIGEHGSSLLAQMPASVFKRIPEISIYGTYGPDVELILSSLPAGSFEVEVAMSRERVPDPPVCVFYEPATTRLGTRVIALPQGAYRRNLYMNHRWTRADHIPAFFPESATDRITRFAFVLGPHAPHAIEILTNIGPLPACRTFVMRPAMLMAQPATDWPPVLEGKIPQLDMPQLERIEIAKRPDETRPLVVQASELALLLGQMFANAPKGVQLLLPSPTVALSGDPGPLNERFTVLYDAGVVL